MSRHPRFLRNRTVSLLFSLGALVASSSWTLESHAVGTRHFVIESGDDFEKGELSGVAVDSAGFLRPGWDLGSLEVPGAQSVWSVLPHAGGLLLGTGSEAKILQVKAGKVEELTRVKDALAVTSIVEAFGKVIVGAMPGGMLYELSGSKLKEFTDLGKGEHVWDLAFDESQKVLYAATGPEGKLYRITKDGTAQVYFDSPHGHLVSVAVRAGRVFAGSSGEARLYEVTGPGRANVLYDFSSTEVRDIELGKSGSIYVIVNELTGGPRTDSVDKTAPGGPARKTAKKGSGKLYRFHENGQPEELHAESSEHFVSLSLDEMERPIVGTGGDGKLIRVGLDHQSAVLADVESRQVSALVGPSGKGWVVASDPVVVHPVEAVGGKDALWTSEVLDAGIRARFGRLSWDADGRVELSTRTGNTKEPDETWKDWSEPLVNVGPVTSEAGRFFQVRARLIDGEKSRIRRIEVPFLTDNLRPILTEVTAKSDATSSGSKGVAPSGGPVSAKPSSKIKLSWEVSNPDQDSLRYRVSYRLLGQSQWVDAHESTEVLTGTSWDWDTEDLPEGRYRVRVTATDELSNPPSRVQSHERQSEVIFVDNTPPRLEKLAIKGSLLSGVVSDGVGPVRRLELKAAGQPNWIPFEPKDGIFDQAREEFSFDLSKLALPAGGLLTVRAFDTAGNIELRHVRLPAAD